MNNLFVQDVEGNYVPANDADVLEAAKALQPRIQRGECIQAPSASKRFLHDAIGRRRAEVFCCLWLDNRHRVIDFQEAFRGTIDGASVYPRELVRSAIDRNAAAVILAHNHPSGVAEPSDADRRITRKVQDALALIDVRVLDHIVIGDGEDVSFAERGLI